MPKKKKRKKTPSREKYEAEHKVISFRVDTEEKKEIDERRGKMGCSYADLTKIGAGLWESRVQQKLETLVLKKFANLEERLEWIDRLLCALFCTLKENHLTAPCPRCEDDSEYRLHLAWGDEIGTDGKRQEVYTWKCPRCSWFVDIFGRMDPESIRWDVPEEAKLALEPKSSHGKRKCVTRRYSGK